MMKAVIPVLILILASVFTRCSAARVCNVTECKASGGVCLYYVCPTDGPKCGDGGSCDDLDELEWRVCIDGTCKKGHDVCNTKKDGTKFNCRARGPQCGNDTFCPQNTLCVDGTCRFISRCGTQKNDTACFFNTGICSNGICFAKCSDSKSCASGFPCVGGYCAAAFCGDTFCYKRYTNP